jgi:SAM-dependent methyltransferase
VTADSIKRRWNAARSAEVAFWDTFLRTRGDRWPAQFQERINPEMPLQAKLDELLPVTDEPAAILDVGAGPLTWVGKRSSRRCLQLTAIDALADEYSSLLSRHGVVPPVPTQRCEAEKIATAFSANQFDLVVARNALDHTYDPVTSLISMLNATRPNGVVYLLHLTNEGRRSGYSEMHQWNLFQVEGRFMMSCRDYIVAAGEMLVSFAEIRCEPMQTEGREWLVVVLRKRA